MAEKKKTDTISREVAVSITTPITLGGNAIQIVPSSSTLEERVAMRIHQAEYFMNFYDSDAIGYGLINDLAASGDSMRFGLAFLAKQPTNGFIALSPGVLDFNSITRFDLGTAAEGKFLIDPMVIKKFSDFPGGGLICHPANLYVFTYCENALTGGTVKIAVKIRYTMEAISDDEWNQLWKQIFVSQAG